MKLISLVIPVASIDNEVYLWGQTRQSFDEFNGFFEFPGGKIEKDEKPQEAALREIFEETNIKLDKSNLDLAFIWNDFLSPTKPIRFYVYLTKSDFAKAKGEYKKLSDLCESSFKIPPINKVFLRKHQDTLSTFATY